MGTLPLPSTLHNGNPNSSPMASSTNLSRVGAYSHGISQSEVSLHLSYDSLKSLASKVVAYHLCQADNNITCMVPEFVHSMAAYMSNAPQLAAYREMLLHEPHVQNALSMRNCIQDPSKAFLTGIIEPLVELKRQGRIPTEMCVILVDSLNEAEFHKPDYGDTIASFLTKHIAKFPTWLKVIVSVRTMLQDLTKFLPFQRVSLDKSLGSDYIHQDVKEYVNYRINNTPAIRNNIALNGKLEVTTQTKFTNHMLALSRGCMLYCKLLLDLIEKGYLVLKSTNYKILPVTLSEIFLLQFNLRLPTIRSFEKISTTLNVCLASLYPLTLDEICDTVNSGCVHNFLNWQEFLQRMDVLSDFLVRRRDSTYMFFHPAFREWLIKRDEHDSSKFLCDLR